MEESDKELMLKYQAGDHMAFNALYARHNDKIYAYLAKRVHDSNKLEDIYQKVFEKLHKSRHLYQDKYDVLPWFYTITKSVFLDALKKKEIETIQMDENQFASEDKLEKESLDLQNEKTLNAKEKEALQYRYFDEKEYQEISELLNTSQSNARKIISRAIGKLKKKYQGVNS